MPPESFQVILLDAHATTDTEILKLRHSFTAILRQTFESESKITPKRLTLLAVDGRHLEERLKPHLILLADPIAFADTRSFSVALRRLSFALRSNCLHCTADVQNLLPHLSKPNVCTSYADSLLSAVAEFTSPPSQQASSKHVRTINLFIFTAPDIASALNETVKLSPLPNVQNAFSSTDTFTRTPFANVHAIAHIDLSKEALCQQLSHILAQSLRSFTSLILPPTSFSQTPLSIPLVLQPRLLLTGLSLQTLESSPPPSDLAPASSIAHTGTSSHYSALTPAMETKQTPLINRSFNTPALPHPQPRRRLASTPSSSLRKPCKSRDAGPSTRMTLLTPTALHVVEAAPRQTLRQDMVYGLPFIAWGESTVAKLNDSTLPSIEPASSQTIGRIPLSSVDLRTDAVLHALSCENRVLICIASSISGHPVGAFAVLPTQQLSRPALALVVPIAHAHACLPIPRIIPIDTLAPTIPVTASNGENYQQNPRVAEDKRVEVFGSDTNNEGVRYVMEIFWAIPVRPFSPPDLQLPVPIVSPTELQLSVEHSRRVRFDDNIHLISD